MPKDAKPKGDSAEDDYEPTVTVTDDVRRKWRAQREKLHRADSSFAQRPFSTRVGVSPGTVSNVETGKQKTLARTVYARWQRELFRTTEIPDDSYDRVVKVFADATETQIQNLFALARIIKDADEDEIKKVLAFYQIIKKPKG